MCMKDRIYGGMIGLATGDALGVPFEGKARGTFFVSGMEGGLAGIAYGAGSIPEEWMAPICRHSMISDMCAGLHAAFYTD